MSVPLAHADDLHDRQEQVEKKLDHADDALEHSSDALRRAYGRLADAQDRLAQARSELASTRERLGEARERDQEMQQRLEEAQARLDQAEADLAAGRDDVTAQQGEVTDMITSIYEEGDPQLRAFSSMLQAQDASDLTWTQEGQSVMVGRETQAYDQLRAAEVLLEVRQGQLADAEEEVAVRREEAADQLVVMRDLTEQARTQRENVAAVVVEARAAKEKAAKARARDAAVMSRLKEQEQRIKDKIARLAARTTGGFTGRSSGFLGWPLQGGYITSPFGFRTHPIYGYYGLHNGTDFGSGSCGTPLVASAAGRVVAKYYSASYGNRLFVYVGRVNGKNLSVVYNHASSYSVGVGQQVSRGQVIGSVGDTGWSTACHLHYTVLENGRPVNPMNYM